MQDPLEIYGSSLAFSPRLSPLYCKYQDQLANTVRVLCDIDFNWSPFLVVLPHDAAITCVAYSNTGAQIVTGTQAGHVSIWDAHSGVRQHSFYATETREAVQSTRFTHKDTTIVLTVRQGEHIFIRSTNHESPSTVKDLEHGDIINDFALCSKGDITKLASASRDSNIRVWNVDSGECELYFLVKTLDTDTPTQVTRIGFITSGDRIVSCSEDQTIRLWDVADGALLRHYNHSCIVNILSVSSDGKQVVFGDTKFDLYRGSAELDGPAQRIHCHGHEILEAMFLSRRSRIVVVDKHGYQVWGGEDFGVARSAKSLGRDIKCSSINPDGDKLATGAA